MATLFRASVLSIVLAGESGGSAMASGYNARAEPGREPVFSCPAGVVVRDGLDSGERAAAAPPGREDVLGLGCMVRGRLVVGRSYRGRWSYLAVAIEKHANCYRWMEAMAAGVGAVYVVVRDVDGGEVAGA